VGYRQFVVKTAQRLNIAGWVRNLPGGEVEAEAQAETETLQRFEAELHRGPALARVDEVKSQNMPEIAASLNIFEINR